jgi:hypothetical protein
MLLVKYLYKYKKLSLPGLGIFTLDKSVVLPDENSRDFENTPNGIEFKSITVRQPDPELIEFICKETGKIRPLALADLDSYLNLGSEMLNIGKPFYMEGIGSLTRRKDGKCDFVPGEFAVIRENTGSQHPDRVKKKKTPQHETAGQDSGSRRKWVIALGVVMAVGIIALGGYLMYKKNLPPSQESLVPAPDTARIMTDTARTIVQKDSISVRPPDTVQKNIVSTDSIQYKFIILSTRDKAYALKRYNQLLGYDLKVHLFTTDSSFFKVFFEFPARSKDTIHIKDSLEREYAHTVTVEH